MRDRKCWSLSLEPADALLLAQVANGNPTAVTIASKDDEVASRVQDLLSTNRFRCYRTTDVQGKPAHKPEAPHRMPDAVFPIDAVLSRSRLHAKCIRHPSTSGLHAL